MPVMKINQFDINCVPDGTKFVLDTNILYYVHSGYYLPQNQQSAIYSNVIQQIMTNGYSIVISLLNLQELLFGIENKEYQIYCCQNNLSKNEYSKKLYRKENSERVKVKFKLQTVLSELSIYEFSSCKISINMINDFVNTFETHIMDPVDYILAKNFDLQKTIFLTDDKDFQSLSSAYVLTKC